MLYGYAVYCMQHCMQYVKYMEEEEVQDGRLQFGVGAEGLIESLHMDGR